MVPGPCQGDNFKGSATQESEGVAVVFPAGHMRAVTRRDGYLPIEDHGLIGDGSTCALVGRDGGISWLCIPEFDSPPFLAGILDVDHGGLF